MEKKLNEEILQIIKYPVCTINNCTVCKEKCDQILTAVKAYTEEEKIQAITSELEHWASFFEDPSMNAMTPSQRLRQRIKQLQRAKEAL